MKTLFFSKNYFLFKDNTLFLYLSGPTNPKYLEEIKKAYQTKTWVPKMRFYFVHMKHQ